MKYLAIVVLSCVTDIKQFDDRDYAVAFLKEKYTELFPTRPSYDFDNTLSHNNTFYIYCGGVSFCFQIMRAEL
jgi:hypothetical protein